MRRCYTTSLLEPRLVTVSVVPGVVIYLECARSIRGVKETGGDRITDVGRDEHVAVRGGRGVPLRELRVASSSVSA